MCIRLCACNNCARKMTCTDCEYLKTHKIIDCNIDGVTNCDYQIPYQSKKLLGLEAAESEGHNGNI